MNNTVVKGLKRKTDENDNDDENRGSKWVALDDDVEDIYQRLRQARNNLPLKINQVNQEHHMGRI